MTTPSDATDTCELRSTTCAHCGLPVPAGLIRADQPRSFCCQGCQVVYEMIHEHGLGDYYALRQALDDTPEPATTTRGRYEAFDHPDFQKEHVRVDHEHAHHVDFFLEGVHCAACLWLIERLPRVVDGMIEARLSLRDRVVRLTWDPSRVALSRIARMLDQLGYLPHPARGQARLTIQRREEHRRLIHLGVAAVCAGNAMFVAIALYAGMFGGMEQQYQTLFRWISLGLGTVALVWPGSVFFRGAWAALRTRTPNLDLPIALALGVGGIAGAVNIVLGRGDIYFDSLAILVFLLLAGRWVQYRQQCRADDAVGLLFSLTPSICRIVRDGRAIESPIEALRLGDRVEVRPGALFPADGQLAVGQSFVNRALLTGESDAMAIAPGDRIHAGTQNVGAVVEMDVTQIGHDTRVGRLMQLVEQGLAAKPPIVQMTDRLSGWFVAGVTLAATVVLIAWLGAGAGVGVAVDHTVALLIVACPCALGLATPLTLAVATGRAARQDVLVKNPAIFEHLARQGHILIDKTGTLTLGKPALVQWLGSTELQSVVAQLERTSSHPIGQALADALKVTQEQPLENRMEQGDGGLTATWRDQLVHVGSPSFMAQHQVQVDADLAQEVATWEAKGCTVVLAALNHRAQSGAALADTLRDDAKQAVSALTQEGWQITMLSGDAQPVVEYIAQQVGIAPDQAKGNVDPEAKLAIVSQDDHAVTVMVGDGVNDAAALSAAQVGIAVHGGAEASLAAADVYIAQPGLMPMVELAALSRHTLRTIRFNLGLCLTYNATAIGFAGAGYITPLVAAILMPISSATVLALAMGRFARPRKGS